MNRSTKPFQKIIVAYDDSPAARQALSVGIELCKILDAPLQTVTVIEPPPAYSAFVVVANSDVAQDLESDRRQRYQEIMESAVAEGNRHSIKVTGHLLEGNEVERVVSFLRAREADLLMIGLPQHSSHISRLWSTVANLEQNAPCSVLAIRALSDRVVGQRLFDEERTHSVSQL